MKRFLHKFPASARHRSRAVSCALIFLLITAYFLCTFHLAIPRCEHSETSCAFCKFHRDCSVEISFAGFEGVPTAASDTGACILSDVSPLSRVLLAVESPRAPPAGSFSLM